MRRLLTLLAAGAIIVGGATAVPDAQAQGSVVVRALRGGQKMNQVLRAQPAWLKSGELLENPAVRALARDPDVAIFLRELENPAVKKYLESRTHLQQMARAVRTAEQSRLMLAGGVNTGMLCTGPQCQLHEMAGLMNRIEAKAAEQAIKVAKPIAPTIRGATVEGVGELTTEVRTSLETVVDAQRLLAERAGNIVKACKGNKACVEAGIETLAKEGRFKRLFKQTCLGRHPRALKAVLYNYLVAYSGLGIATLAADNEEFPFDLFIYMAIANAMYGELACRNTFERNGASALGENQPYFTWKNVKANLIAYAKVEPINISLLIGLSMAEDKVRGRDVLSAEYLEKYGKEAAFLAIFDLGILNMRAVFLTDPFFLKAMPRMSEGLNRAWQGSVMSHVSARNFAVSAASVAPGMVLETGSRVGYQALERTLFLNLREQYAPNPEEPGTEPDPNDTP